MATKEKLTKSRKAPSSRTVAATAKLRRLPTTVVAEPSAPRIQLTLAICVLLALVTFAVYFRATKNPFVNYDDPGYVTENVKVQQGLTQATLRWALTSTEANNWHPLTWMSHALDCQLFGLSPGGHHFTSVLLHVLNATLLFLLLATATGMRGRSLLVAAIFALHPMNVESVAWVAERKSVLSMFFFLLTLAAYGWYAQRPKVQRYLAVTALFILGLAAKPMIVTLPFVLLLLDFWPLQRVRGFSSPPQALAVPQRSILQLILEKLPLLALAAASSVITMIAQGQAVATNAGLPVSVRLANSLYAYSMYLGNAFWPARLASFYPYEGPRLAVWQLSLFVLLLAGLTVIAWRMRSRAYIPVGWFWFLGTLIPMIGLVQVGDQAMADRYAYLPLIGIFWIVVWGVADWLEDRRFNLQWGTLAGTVAVALLAFSTWHQIGFWNSSYDLWSHALQTTKDNYMAEDYVGTTLLLNNFIASGQRSSREALVHFQNAARINPRDAISHLNLGADFHEHGQLSEAIAQYQLVLGLTQDPHLILKSLIDIGSAYDQMGDYVASRQYYQEALKIDPTNQTVFVNLGKLAMDQRIEELAASATARPSATTYLQLGQLQQAAGHVTEARASYAMALKFDPKLPHAQDALDSLGHGNNR
jgi:tetratricopeptide (TPR) repeat protein